MQLFGSAFGYMPHVQCIIQPWKSVFLGLVEKYLHLIHQKKIIFLWRNMMCVNNHLQQGTDLIMSVCADLLQWDLGQEFVQCLCKGLFSPSAQSWNSTILTEELPLSSCFLKEDWVAIGCHVIFEYRVRMSHKQCAYCVKIYYQQFYNMEANLSDSPLTFGSLGYNWPFFTIFDFAIIFHL